MTLEMQQKLLAQTLAEQAHTVARIAPHIISAEDDSAVEGRSEHVLDPSNMEEGVLPQAPEGDLRIASPVSEASAEEPSSHAESSLFGLAKLQIVELLLARQGKSSDDTDSINRLMRFTKSELVSQALTGLDS